MPRKKSEYFNREFAVRQLRAVMENTVSTKKIKWEFDKKSKIHRWITNYGPTKVVVLRRRPTHVEAFVTFRGNEISINSAVLLLQRQYDLAEQLLLFGLRLETDLEEEQVIKQREAIDKILRKRMEQIAMAI